MQGKGNTNEGNDHQGSANRNKKAKDRELRNSNSGPREINSSTQSLTSEPPSFNANEAAKYLNDLWVSVNEREPLSVYKDTEKAWGVTSKGSTGTVSGSSPFLVSSSNEFLTELHRAYSKLTQVSL